MLRRSFPFFFVNIISTSVLKCTDRQRETENGERETAHTPRTSDMEKEKKGEQEKLMNNSNMEKYLAALLTVGETGGQT